MADKRKSKSKDEKKLADLLDNMVMEARGHVGAEETVYLLSLLSNLEAKIADLRRHVANKDIYKVALEAMDVHYFYDQISYDRSNRTAKVFKTEANQEKARAKKVSNAAIRKQEITQAVRQRLIDHPRDSIEYARKIVADEHKDENGKSLPGWSLENIRLLTRGMKKPNKK